MNSVADSVTPKVELALRVSEGQPAVKARNGRWVEGKQVVLVIELRAALPGNVIIEPTNVRGFVKFSRHVDEPAAWSVKSDAAHAFQAWVASFGEPAVNLVRAELEKWGLLSLFRFAVAPKTQSNNE